MQASLACPLAKTSTACLKNSTNVFAPSARFFPTMDKSWGTRTIRRTLTSRQSCTCVLIFARQWMVGAKKSLFHLSWCLICQEKQKVPFPPIHKEVDREVFWRQKGGQEAISHLFTFSLLPVHLGTFKPHVFSSQALEVGAQFFFRQKKWQFFHQKWWFSRWITENGDNIGEGTGDIFSDCWKSWNSCHNYCHLFWWQYCHQIWWRFFHRKWWLSKWITVKGEKSGERKGDVLGEC